MIQSEIPLLVFCTYKSQSAIEFPFARRSKMILKAQLHKRVLFDKPLVYHDSIMLRTRSLCYELR